MPTDWEAVLLAYLHDPPGKALGVRGHELRAAPLASIALGHEIDSRTIHADTRTEDQLASLVERAVPLPTAGEKGERAVGPAEGRLWVVHPLSGQPRVLDTSALAHDSGAEEETLRNLLAGLETSRARFLALWRLWRERLAARQADWLRLPADTRLPDHTVWNHLDAAAGVRPSLGQHGVALLTFSLGPVQPFIAGARTVRDLWTGSYLLAWLTFAALGPVLEDLGPGAVIAPALRGNPLTDRWLRGQGLSAELFGEQGGQQVLSPCLPNRFTAFVPWGKDGEAARAIAGRCESACRDAWCDVAEAVRDRLTDAIRRERVPHSDGWDRLWNDQVRSFFEVRTAVLPMNDCDDVTLGRLLHPSGELKLALPDAFAVRALAEVLNRAGHAYGFRQESAGLWAGRMQVLAGLGEALRSVRHVPAYDPKPDATGQWPGKCGLMGTYEQVGPAGLEESAAFWNGMAAGVAVQGTRVRPGERLCAVSLVKRFAWPAYLARELDLPVKELRYPDTATVAARLWLDEGEPLDPDSVRRTHDDWSGMWLYGPERDRKPDEEEPDAPEDVRKRILAKHSRQGPPPAYYAVLMLDGDGLGKWIRGDSAPKVREVLHPKLVEYYEQNGGAAHPGLAARRPVGPALQAAISEALTNYALHFVPEIISRHRGTLIYAGGDDVLALLPARTALGCARELAETFRQDWTPDGSGRERLLMGSRATVSAGLVVVHYKDDLRFALQAARDAEKEAKSAGRDALTVRVCRRSGEDSRATLGWGQVEALERLVDFFAGGISDRWCYRLRAELPTLAGGPVPWGAARAEVRRLLDRLDEADETRRAEFCKTVDDFLAAYHADCRSERRRERRTDDELKAWALEGFVTLCQSASFLARGRDQR
jgi:CRISPR-associated protein Cmr2